MSTLKTFLGFSLIASCVTLFPAMTAQAGALDLPTQTNEWMVRFVGLGMILLTLRAMDHYLWPRLATRDIG